MEKLTEMINAFYVSPEVKRTIIEIADKDRRKIYEVIRMILEKEVSVYRSSDNYSLTPTS